MTSARQTGGTTQSYLVRGDDPSMVGQAARALIERLAEGREPALVVEEHGGSPGEELDVGAVVDAITTPPMLVDRRVVVVRDAGRLTATEGARLAEVVKDPPSPNVLVVVSGGGAVPQSLVKAIGASGVIDTTLRTARDRSQWLDRQLQSAPVRLTAGAAKRLDDHLGEDLGRVAGILETLLAAHGNGATVNEEQLEPFLGEGGAVAPWELTDAIDAGQTPQALTALRRMSGAGGRGVPEVIAILHRHVSNMLQLDGADVTSGDEAAALLGVHPFVARKALAGSRRLGTEALAQAIVLLAQADLDSKGESGLPGDVVTEVLVARLCRLSRAHAPGGRRSRSQQARRR